MIEFGELNPQLLVFIFTALLSIPLFFIGWIQLHKSSFHRVANWEQIDRMSQQEFEQFLASLFSAQGYSVSRTNQTIDTGAHLILRKRGIKAIVHIKKQPSKLEVQGIQEIVLVQANFRANAAFIVSNDYFPKATQKFAAANQIKLINRDSLDTMIDGYYRPKRNHRFIERVRTLWTIQENKEQP